MIVGMISGVTIIVWLIFGTIICIMAGVTHDFHKRFFNPVWMILLGPFGPWIWLWMEDREGKRRKKK